MGHLVNQETLLSQEKAENLENQVTVMSQEKAESRENQGTARSLVNQEKAVILRNLMLSQMW